MIKKVIVIILTGLLLVASGCSGNTGGETVNKATNSGTSATKTETMNNDERETANETDRETGNEAGIEVVNEVDGESANEIDGETENEVGSEIINEADGETINGQADSETSAQKDHAVASLGGIPLGDSPESITAVLGNDYTESAEPDVAGIIGEDVTVWSYESGIVVYIGQTSGKVIKVISTSPDMQTDLGIKVGDNAKTVLEAYKPLYKEAVSRHRDEALEGWFFVEDGTVMIFDFDKSDGVVVNSNITQDSKVEEIILAHWKHFD